jgi:hypothetical protein
MTLPVVAAWERHVVAGGHETIDHPPAHSLAFFTRQPLLRSEDPNTFWNLTPEQKVAQAKSEKATVEVNFVGTLRDFAIYDVLIRFEQAERVWKLILVKIGPNRFREIYHLEAAYDTEIEHPFVAKVGPEYILVSRDVFAGNGVETCQAYFWFDKGGPMWIDWSPIWQAARSVAPKDSWVIEVNWSSRQDIIKSTFPVPVRGDGDSTCCRGFVHVHFSVERGHIIVRGATYDADAEH